MTNRDLGTALLAANSPIASLLSFTLDPALEWQASALCAQTDPEAYFPEKGGSANDAKRVCRSCDVRERCLDWADAVGMTHGVWGGLTVTERKRRRSKLAKAADAAKTTTRAVAPAERKAA